MFDLAFKQFCILLFADDCVLLARSVPELQFLTDTFSTFCSENGLSINTDKTECMLINCVGIIQVNQQPLKIVDTFRYLGFMLSKDSIDPSSIILDRIKKC